MNNPSPTTNFLAILSFIAALFTVLTFCFGFAPIPLSAVICYPVSTLLGIVSLVSGLRALRQMDRGGETGRTLALIGVWTGALTLTGVVCFSALGIWLLPRAVEFIQQNWPRP